MEFVNARSMDIIRQEHIFNPSGLSLPCVLYKARSLEAAQIRDNIYGALGLTENNTRKSIAVDYAISIGDLMLNIARVDLLHDPPHFEGLSLTGESTWQDTRTAEDLDGLEVLSWCPHWFRTPCVVQNLSYNAGTFRRRSSKL
jgi:hypothetical protein